MTSRSRVAAFAAALVLCTTSLGLGQQVSITGSDGLRRWHKITLSIAGPQADEAGSPNPFLDLRLEVVFTHDASGLRYRVPGYFAADGAAADSSASSGDVWRAHLCPDRAGRWRYAVSFRQGSGVAISDGPLDGSPVAPFDGLEGSFDILETDKSGRDLRGKGRLAYVGRHHLRFADGEHFLKAGADSPENLLAYDDFDGTPDNGGLRKSWAPHRGDWRDGDPTWKSDRGKGLIGALNYLSSKGANAISFLTYSYHGDDGNVFPYARAGELLRMDCSKLDQWEIVFEHADRVGLFLHFKLHETENDRDMDGGGLETERRLYYRELIARFAHHLALNWNLGEEINASAARVHEYARYFHEHDPYGHPIVVHTYPEEKSAVYGPLLGESDGLMGVSLQSYTDEVFAETLEWRRASAAAGLPWDVANTEQGPSGDGVLPDDDDPEHDDIRRNVLWGNILAGGSGVEYYFGYGYEHSDLTCEDFRSRDLMWDISRFALDLFRLQRVPFHDMENRNDLVSGAEAWCLAGAGHWVIYQRDSGEARLDLRGIDGTLDVRWYDPRRGGDLEVGSVTEVAGGGIRALGAPSGGGSARDRVILVRAAGGRQTPGDCNQDGEVDVADAVCILLRLFVDSTLPLPCGDGAAGHSGNAALLDFSAGGAAGAIDISDAVALLRYLFQAGPAHPLGAGCVRLVECPDVCGGGG